MPESLAILLQCDYRYALSLAHHTAKAEDLLPDAWVAVIQAGGPHEKDYLFCAIRSRYYNLYKRERLVPMESLESIAEPVHQLIDVDYAHDFHDPLLEAALAQLRGIEREVLYLNVAEGYTALGITTITGLARGTVLSMLTRTRKKIQCYFSANEIKVVSHE
ncbi:MAG: RNA polymerase subunit sigma-70 [Gammaproteobacteria bacterium]|nr:RNA polymerase subunit sigma-70 [Gammaproteobacteria bacterium]